MSLYICRYTHSLLVLALWRPLMNTRSVGVEHFRELISLFALFRCNCCGCLVTDCSVAKSGWTLCLPMDGTMLASSSVHGDLPGKNTGVGCHFLLQAIFVIQGLNPCLPHWQADSLPLNHQGNPLVQLESSKAKPYS